ncbi:MAG: T9SS type A sorting domain-containing protein, partial [Bacteroidota bacterium]
TVDLTFASGGFLTLLSAPGYSASVGPIGTGNVITYGTGKIVMQKYITLPETNYRDFTSPIINSTLKRFEYSGLELTGISGSQYPDPDIFGVNIYKYNEADPATVDDGWVAATATTDKIVTNSSPTSITRSGWRIYCGDASPKNITLSDTGQIFRDDLTFPLTFTHGSGSRTADDGWHLIGNPFPSNISWSLVHSSNPTVMIDAGVTDGIEPTVYVYAPTDNGNQVNDEDNYSFYNPVTMSGTAAVLTPFQGFWVKTTDHTNSTNTFNLTVPESSKTTSNGNFFKAATSAPAMVTVTISDGTVSDRVDFHTFPHATLGKDAIYDVNKFNPAISDKPAKSLGIDFAAAALPLHLRVNAIPESNASFTLPLYVHSAAAGNAQTLSFTNLEAIAANYGCVSLHDLSNNTWTDLKSTSSYSYTGSDFDGVRFEIVFENAIQQQATVVDATCFDSHDGLLRVKFEDASYKSFDLLKGAEVVKTFKGDIALIKTTLSNGEYKLVNNLASPACALAAYTFTVNSLPEIVFGVATPANEIYAGKEVQFTNTTSGAASFIWTFMDDNSTSTEANAVHTFKQPGMTAVSLEAISANEQCSKTKTYNFDVQDASGITNTISEKAISAILKDGNIQLTNSTTETYDVVLYSTDGRVVAKQTGITGNYTITSPSATGTYLLTLSSNGKTRTQKFVL